jgi:NAD-dependent DNA ligase
MSGTRNKQIIEYVSSNGGEVLSSMPKLKKVDYLIVKDKSKTSEKIKIAQNRNITILNEFEFISKFNL